MLPPRVPLWGQGFISLTFTRAQSKSVRKRWRKDAPSATEEFLHGACPYVQELDIILQPFDLVLWVPVVARTVDMISDLISVACPSAVSKSVVRDQRLHSVPGSQISTSDLPLVYVKANTVRLFVPHVRESKKMDINCDANHGQSREARDDVSGSFSLLPLSQHADMLVVQIDTVSLAPQADNPLQRLVVRKDLFQKAERAQITHIPGADIEDRQYQLDITSFSVSTGRYFLYKQIFRAFFCDRTSTCDIKCRE